MAILLWPKSSIRRTTDSFEKLFNLSTLFPRVLRKRWLDVLESYSTSYFLNIIFRLTLTQDLSIGFVPYRFKKRYWLLSVTPIWILILEIRFFKSGLILIFRVFLVFCSTMMRNSFSSNCENRS